MKYIIIILLSLLIVESKAQQVFDGNDNYVVIVDFSDSAEYHYIETGITLFTNSVKASQCDSIQVLDTIAKYKANLSQLPDSGQVKRNEIYTYNDKMLRVIQTHERSEVNHFEPTDLQALYMFREPGCAEWVQPTGGHDAYNIGDCVTLNGYTYKSNINSNTTNPEDFNDEDSPWDYWDKEPFNN